MISNAPIFIEPFTSVKNFACAPERAKFVDKNIVLLRKKNITLKLSLS